DAGVLPGVFAAHRMAHSRLAGIAVAVAEVRHHHHDVVTIFTVERVHDPAVGQVVVGEAGLVGERHLGVGVAGPHVLPEGLGGHRHRAGTGVDPAVGHPARDPRRRI